MSTEGSPEEPPRSKVFRISKKVREDAVARVRIGVAGNGGSFSQKAALTFATERYQKEGEKSLFAVIEIVWLITTRAVLEALQRKEIDIGVYATMNNHGGMALENAEAAANIPHSYVKNSEDMPTVIKLPVQHVLMTRPGAKGRIRTIVTQPQAYEQCKATIKRRWPKARILYYDDTATAAKDLATGALKDVDWETTAVVGPEDAANENKLVVRKTWFLRRKHVQDYKTNATSFAIVKRFSPEDREEDTLRLDEAPDKA